MVCRSYECSWIWIRCSFLACPGLLCSSVCFPNEFSILWVLVNMYPVYISQLVRTFNKNMCVLEMKCRSCYGWIIIPFIFFSLSDHMMLIGVFWKWNVDPVSVVEYWSRVYFSACPNNKLKFVCVLEVKCRSCYGWWICIPSILFSLFGNMMYIC